MPRRIIFVLIMHCAVFAQAQSPWFGAWKLNLEKSTANRDARYKRVMLVISPWQDGLKVAYDMVGTRGGVSHMEWTGKFDGRDYPIQGLDTVVTNAYSLVSDHGYRIVVKVDGAPAATATVVVSADGRTLTSVTSEKNRGGENVTATS